MTVGVTFRKDLNPTLRGGSAQVDSEEYARLIYLRNNFAYFFEVCTPPQVRFGQKVFDEPRPYIISHFFKFFVYFIVVLIVLDELDYQGTVSQCEQLCVLSELDGRRHMGGRALTIFSVLPFHRSSPMFL